MSRLKPRPPKRSLRTGGAGQRLALQQRAQASARLAFEKLAGEEKHRIVEAVHDALPERNNGVVC